MSLPIIFTTNCPKCNGRMGSIGTMMTLVGYSSPPGHNHDDNCRHRMYDCQKCDHTLDVYIRNRCPVCDWVGKEECFCHPDKKVDK